jgi:hypothetical protein
LATGPGRTRQTLAQQTLAQRGQEGGKAWRLRETGAGVVGDMDRAGALRIQQSRHTDLARIEFQRIDQPPRDTTQQHIHPLQPAQGLDEHHPAAHREIAAFHQRAGQFAREEHMLEPLVMPRAGGQQRHRGAGAATGCEALQLILPDIKERPELPHRHRAERFGQHAGQKPAVLPRVADAGGIRGAVRKHAPATVRPTHQIGRVKAEPGAHGRRHRAVAEMQRAEKPGIAEHQSWRHGTGLEQ